MHLDQAHPSQPHPPAALPLVSCIMPTHNRRPFLPSSIAHFLRQDNPAKELIILNDGRDSVADLMPGNPCIRRVSGRDDLVRVVRHLVSPETSQGEIIQARQ